MSVDILDVKRRLFDLMASSIGRHILLREWFYFDRLVRLPFHEKTVPDSTHIFKTIVTVPDSELKWLLKLIISGNALLKVNGAPYVGIDEAHTYTMINPGTHELELVVSPRSLFGYHKWYLLFEEAYLVEVSWEVFSFALKALKLAEFVEGLPKNSVLRSELEGLLYRVFAETRLNPSIRQIALANIILYGSMPIIFFTREEIPRPYGYYQWLTGVYGYGVLKRVIADIEEEDLNKTLEITRIIKGDLDKGLRELVEKFGKQGLALIIGHSHIDAAWLWPRKETIRKVIRTFSTLINLMKEYEFNYIQSSALYYEWLENREPQLFEKVKKLVDTGKWILAGGTWVETDTLLVEGEGLVRQFLYGQRYFKSRFNKTARIGWLPDSFGFSCNLPQIMKLSGLDVFITHKVMWNDTNEFPYHAFKWQGIDGSEIPVHVIVLSYGEPVTPISLHRYWERYKNKKEVPFIVYTYGYSNGGGGPTREMLELIEINEKLPGIPRLEHFEEDKYISLFNNSKDKLPVWRGEIYLEVHRGTYTTNIEIKELLAKAEIALIQAEIVATTTSALTSEKVNKKTLDSLWKRLLFNYFHDIIPGSSIREVYEEARKDLQQVIEESNKLTSYLLSKFTQQVQNKRSLLIFNTLPWRRRTIIKMKKDQGIPIDENGNVQECQEVGEEIYVKIDLPPLGYRVLELKHSKCDGKPGAIAYELGDSIVLENEHLIVKINKDGDFESIKLKNQNIEILRESSNKIIAHIDKPGTWDAWDIKEDSLYYSKPVITIGKPAILLRGPLVSCVSVTRGFEKSKIIQEICLYKEMPIIEVKCRIQWYSKGILIKAWFSLNANETKAFFDAPYGVVERSTRANSMWDKAKYEIPALRWADLSSRELGLTIIAPSRHGYTSRGNTLGLSIIRSPLFPNPWSDLGEFETTYYIYPHAGDFVNAHVPKVTQEILHRVLVVPVQSSNAEFSFLEINPPKVILGAFKPAEDGEGYVLRLYNPYYNSVNVRLKFNPVLKVSKILELDLLELSKLNEHDLQDNEVSISLEPHKIKTLKIDVYK